MKKERKLDYLLTTAGFLVSAYTVIELSQSWAIIGTVLAFGDIIRTFLRNGKKNEKNKKK